MKKPVYIIFLDDQQEFHGQVAIYDSETNMCIHSDAEGALRYLMNEPERCRCAYFNYETPHNLGVENLDAIEDLWCRLAEGYDIPVTVFQAAYNIIISEV